MSHMQFCSVPQEPAWCVLWVQASREPAGSQLETSTQAECGRQWTVALSHSFLHPCLLFPLSLLHEAFMIRSQATYFFPTSLPSHFSLTLPVSLLSFFLFIGFTVSTS